MKSKDTLKSRNILDRNKVLSNYVLTDGTDTASRLNAREVSRYARWRIGRDVNQMMRMTQEGDAELHPEEQAMYMQARDFVESEVGYDLSDVKASNTHLTEGNGMQAGYSQVSDSIQFFGGIDYDANHDEAEYQKELAMEVIVHELMHATGGGNLRMVNIKAKRSPRNVASIAGHTSLDMRHASLEEFAYDYDKNIRLGDYFEEGFAEEGATRWREHVLGKLEGLIQFSRDDIPDLPRRYVTLPDDYGIDGGKVARGVPAYAAAGLYILSAYTKVDIYELIKEGRDPSRAADAKRAVISAIESVKKGLYVTLREAKYSDAGFTEAYIAVIDAVNEAIDQKQKQQLGKIAIETDQ